MIIIIFIALCLVLGANSPLVKFTTQEFSPVITVTLRSILAILILLPFINFKKLFLVKTSKKYLLLVNLLFAGNWLLFAYGIQHTSVIMSAAIYLPSSLIVAIFGYLFLKEKLGNFQIIGMISTLMGMSLLIYGSAMSQDIRSLGTLQGNFLILIALLSWSFFLVVSRKISQSIDPSIITLSNFIVSFLASLIFIFIELLLGNQLKLSVSLPAVVGILSLAIFSSLIVYYLYQWLLKHAPAFISSLAIYPAAALASLYGIIFFGERITATFLFGASLILFGVFLATSYKYVKIKLIK
ncbi:DMT family transporter [Candidatus Curtissbacteria bacterium]|nr:DMT family transporter [Candidatus Curtissbacteria bacterium]